MMKFSEFVDFVNGFTGERPIDQRLGQWAFNLLFETYPDISERIRCTDYDPFFDDNKLPNFLRRVLDFVKMDDKL